MKKLLVKIIAVAFFMCSINIPAFADELNSDIKAGITPDSIFYFIDRAVENIQLALEKNPEKKIIILACISGERIAEAKIMADEKKDQLSVKAALDSQQAQTKAQDIVKIEQQNVENKDADAQKKLEDAVNKLNEESKRSVERLKELLNKVPETAKPAIQKAIDNQTAMKEAIENYIKLRQAVIDSKNKVDELEKALKDAKASNDTQKAAVIQEQLNKAAAYYNTAKQNLIQKMVNVKEIKKEIKKEFKEAKKEIKESRKADKNDEDKDNDEQKIKNNTTGSAIKVIVQNEHKKEHEKEHGKDKNKAKK